MARKHPCTIRVLIAFQPAALLTHDLYNYGTYLLRESAIFGLRPQIDVYLFVFPSYVHKVAHLTNYMSQISIRFLQKKEGSKR